VNSRIKGKEGEFMYPKAYTEYLAHFHGDRDYFECHEILEEYWKREDKANKSSIWVGFILLAVSTYHHRRSNFPGALRTLQKSITLFTNFKTELSKLGINPELFHSLLKSQLSCIENGDEYSSICFPITSQDLIAHCVAVCEEKGMGWCTHSDIDNYNLLHRHRTRDRSDVVLERKMSLKKKNKGSE
jgi:uncharacterized protein